MRGVVIISDERWASAAVELAEANGWPIVAEPAANVRSHNVTPHAPLFLNESFTPELVVTFERFGLSRPVNQLVRRASRHIAVSRGGHVDPLFTAERTSEVPHLVDPADQQWLAMWKDASARAAKIVQNFDGFNALTIVRDIGQIATGNVFLAASRTIRDAEMTWSTCRARVFMNRGTNGIDGLVSTAWGIAAATGERTIAVLGDLAYAHDTNGLMHDHVNPVPDITYVVIDNDGGAIFSSLEQGRPEYAKNFERVFGTPHFGDLRFIGPVHTVTSLNELPEALSHKGLNTVHIRLDRRQEQEELARLNRIAHSN